MYNTERKTFQENDTHSKHNNKQKQKHIKKQNNFDRIQRNTQEIERRRGSRNISQKYSNIIAIIECTINFFSQNQFSFKDNLEDKSTKNIISINNKKKPR